MRWFLPFLGFIFFAELVGEYQWGVFGIPTIDINYLIGIVESIFYGFIFYKLTNRLISKRLIFLGVLISVIVYIVSFVFFKKDHLYLFEDIIVSGFILSLISLMYLYFKSSDDDETILLYDPGFWIAFGVAIFYSGISISFSLHDFIKNNNLTFFGANLINVIPRYLSVILYSSISIAIILCKHQKKLSSLQS